MAIDIEHLIDIFHQFKQNASILDLELLTTGHINKAFVVALADELFILQSINRQVFPEPLLVMNNLNEVMTSFLEDRVDTQQFNYQNLFHANLMEFLHGSIQ